MIRSKEEVQMIEPLSNEKVEAMLSRLAEHFGEPVQPISRYCASLRLWQRALHERADRALYALAPELEGEKDLALQYKIFSAINREVQWAETFRD